MQIARLRTAGPASREAVQRAGSGVGAVSAAILSAPFRAMRAVYWALDHDAKVRALGIRTVGRVTDTRTRTRTGRDPECGDEYTVTEHFVDYRYDDQDGVSRTGVRQVRNFEGIQRGGMIDVYHMVHDPRDSALEGTPRTLRLGEIEQRRAMRQLPQGEVEQRQAKRQLAA